MDNFKEALLKDTLNLFLWSVHFALSSRFLVYLFFRKKKNIYIYIFLYIHIYIYIYREREREIDRYR